MRAELNVQSVKMACVMIVTLCLSGASTMSSGCRPAQQPVSNRVPDEQIDAAIVLMMAIGRATTEDFEL